MPKKCERPVVTGLEWRVLSAVFVVSGGRLELAQVVRDLARHDAIACLQTLHPQMLEIGSVLNWRFQNALG